MEDAQTDGQVIDEKNDFSRSDGNGSNWMVYETWDDGRNALGSDDDWSEMDPFGSVDWFLSSSDD